MVRSAVRAPGNAVVLLLLSLVASVMASVGSTTAERTAA
jgi:hypothetical protein